MIRTCAPRQRSTDASIFPPGSPWSKALAITLISACDSSTGSASTTGAGDGTRSDDVAIPIAQAEAQPHVGERAGKHDSNRCRLEPGSQRAPEVHQIVENAQNASSVLQLEARELVERGSFAETTVQGVRRGDHRRERSVQGKRHGQVTSRGFRQLLRSFAGSTGKALRAHLGPETRTRVIA